MPWGEDFTAPQERKRHPVSPRREESLTDSASPIRLEGPSHIALRLVGLVIKKVPSRCECRVLGIKIGHLKDSLMGMMMMSSKL